MKEEPVRARLNVFNPKVCQCDGCIMLVSTPYSAPLTVALRSTTFAQIHVPHGDEPLGTTALHCSRVSSLNLVQFLPFWFWLSWKFGD